MVKKGQKDIFSSQFFTRKSLEVFLDHLRLKTKFCKKCPIFVERVPYQKTGFLYFWKYQTEWFSLKLNHVYEIWWFEKLLFNKPDFTRLSKLVNKKFSQSNFRHFLINAAWYTWYMLTSDQTASKNIAYIQSYMKRQFFRFDTSIWVSVSWLLLGLLTSYFTQDHKIY